MMSLFIDSIAWMFFGFFTMIVFHEMGHYLAMNKHDKQTKIVFNGKSLATMMNKNIFSKLSFNAQRNTYWQGIIFGFVPIVAIAYFSSPAALTLLLLYTFGFWGDIVQIRKITKKENAWRIIQK